MSNKGAWEEWKTKLNLNVKEDSNMTNQNAMDIVKSDFTNNMNNLMATVVDIAIKRYCIDDEYECNEFMQDMRFLDNMYHENLKDFNSVADTCIDYIAKFEAIKGFTNNPDHNSYDNEED